MKNFKQYLQEYLDFGYEAGPSIGAATKKMNKKYFKKLKAQAKFKKGGKALKDVIEIIRYLKK